jgi:competence protein ComEC
MIWLVVFSFRLGTNFQAEAKLREFEGRVIKVSGRISSEPLLQGSIQSFRIGRLVVKTKQYPQYEYGQKVQVSGSLQRRMINKWYSRFSLMYPDVKEVKPDKTKIMGLGWKDWIYDIRGQIELVYNRSIPEPEASLLAGIVLGVKRSLTKDFWLKLQKTSTLHIVVASGYNVTVVIGTVIFALAGWVNRRWAIGGGILAVIVYTIMAGAEPAIVRAAIMGSLAYLAQALGRQSEGFRLLLVAVLGMLTWQPLLVFDVGFQLSIAATLGLMFISPVIKRATGFIKGIGDDIAETSSAQLAVWPIIVISFGNMSLFGILVNGLILWLVPIIMALGAVTAVVGLVWWPLGRLAGWLTYVPLKMMVLVIDWFAEQSWISYQVGELSWLWGIGYYLVLIFIIFKVRNFKSRYVEMDK